MLQSLYTLGIYGHSGFQSILVWKWQIDREIMGVLSPTAVCNTGHIWKTAQTSSLFSRWEGGRFQWKPTLSIIHVRLCTSIPVIALSDRTPGTSRRKKRSQNVGQINKKSEYPLDSVSLELHTTRPNGNTCYVCCTQLSLLYRNTSDSLAEQHLGLICRQLDCYNIACNLGH